MEEIVIPDVETHQPIERAIFNEQGDKKVGRFLTPLEVLVELASREAGVNGNLLHHGWRYRRIPERAEHLFYLRTTTQTP